MPKQVGTPHFKGLDTAFLQLSFAMKLSSALMKSSPIPLLKNSPPHDTGNSVR
jgi:hypothetical protein